MKEKNNSGFAPVLFLVLLLAVLGGIGGYYLWQQKGSVKVLPTPTSTADPTASWKTYTNEKYKFSIKYPQDWKYLEVPNQTYQTENNQVWFNPQTDNWPPAQTDARSSLIFSMTSTDPSTNWKPENFIDYKETTYNLGNVLATEISGQNKEGLFNETIIFGKIGKDYITVLFGSRTIESVHDQILSTFKLLESSKYDTCPASGYVDCMPKAGESPSPLCSKDYLDWAKANCPNFKGTLAPSPTPTPKTSTTYSCPEREWVNCMPGPQLEDASQCDQNYLIWAKAHCPGFKGAAY